ncbi:MAG: hypothetical protein K2R98_18200 [Gemmataceae bacterium]|nr:hypothetical protein [Gemmataceae bacterium]
MNGKQPVAILRQAFWGADERVFWLKAVWAAAFLAGMLLSPQLWVSSRTYPLCPVTDALPEIPYPLDYAWYGAVLLLLAAILLIPRPRRLLLAFVGLAGLLSVWDQSRWQPWFYQYLSIGIALAAYPWRDPEGQPERRSAALNACRIIVAATYFWSGLQKFNPLFIDDIFPWLLEPILALLPDALGRLALGSASAVPFVEAGIGIGLLIPLLRPFAVAGVVGMHMVILGCIGPWGLDHNSVVWPWNLALPILTALLFVQTQSVGFTDLVRPQCWLHGLAVVFFGILPALDFVGLWDAYLSASLYSGSTPRASIFVQASVYDRAPEPMRAYLFRADYDQYRLNLGAWSMDEMNVPAYPARRVHQSIARRYLLYADHPSEVMLEYWDRPDWQTGRRTSTQYSGEALAK